MQLFRHLSEAVRRRRRAGHDSPLPAMLRRPSVKPILPVADLVAATAFYRGLGFDVSAYDDGYAWVNHCGWELFHLRLVPELGPGGNDASAYVHVDDADGWRAALAGSESSAEIGPVADMPWGMREFSFSDPSGNVIRVGQNL
jgi:catechol 2,3-dioxygenase-like lactoylglutathione lyase family enzyme